MAVALTHTSVEKMMEAFAEAKVINLDVPVRTLVESARSSLPDDRPGDEFSLHILCCNEYFLVTGIVAQPIEDLRPFSGQVRDSLE